MDVEFRSRGYRLLTAALLLAGSAAAAQAPRSVRLPLERADGPPREARAPALPPLPQITPVIPMVFPIVGEVGWTDTYNPVGGNGYRRHRGQDLMAPRHRPLVAVFDGVVQLHRRGTHYMLILRGDNGFTAWYMHLNNDTPGTDDGQGPPEYAYARGLSTGDRVRAGQLVGWVGDSGNAENTEP
ncbi:MAG: M23 family metallopeptidase, partial [Armatimonadetes bacterium]|nr:M23 family metallopeptidase [Armatimonadota bacterium]